jgi:hypothetical protein
MCTGVRCVGQCRVRLQQHGWDRDLMRVTGLEVAAAMAGVHHPKKKKKFPLASRQPLERLCAFELLPFLLLCCIACVR